jgi:hypothetical protein
MRYAEVGAGAGGEAVDVCVSTYAESREKVANFEKKMSQIPVTRRNMLLYDRPRKKIGAETSYVLCAEPDGPASI